MWPLKDITVYTDKQEPTTEFRMEINYISDLYHDRLHGYKPPKTGRICLYIIENKQIEKPYYFGAICSYNSYFDFKEFNKIKTKSDKYKFILDFIHNTILEISDLLKWDKEVFIKSYESIIKDKFQFIKEYPIKKSKDNRTSGQAIIEKTENKTTLKIKITNGQTFETKIIEKKNWFWYDSGYDIADKMKWIDKDSFGYKSKTSDKEVYYSTKDKKVISNLIFNETDL